MFSRLTIEMLIGYVMCIFLVIQCSKKKPEKSAATRQSKQLLEPSAVMSVKQKPSKDKALDIKKSGEDVQKSEQKKSGKSAEGRKGNSKMGKKGSKQSGKTGEKDNSANNKVSGGPSKPMDGTQNGPTPNDPTGNNSLKEVEIETLHFDDMKEIMEDTTEEYDNPAVHPLVTRLAATEMIFDPKMVQYKGNVDNEKDPKEIEDFEKELVAACDKHDARFKDIRRFEEKDPNYRRPKSTESEKSTDKKAPVPPDQRIKMRPDQCVLYETKEVNTEEDDDNPDQSNDANK